MLGFFEKHYNWIFSGIGVIILLFLWKKAKQQFYKLKKWKEEYQRQTRNVLIMAILSEKYMNDKNSFVHDDNVKIRIGCRNPVLKFESCCNDICLKNRILDCTIERARLCDTFLKQNKYNYIFFYQRYKIKKIYDNGHQSYINEERLTKIQSTLIKNYEKYFNK